MNETQMLVYDIKNDETSYEGFEKAGTADRS